ncbi:MAG: GAF domain-containing protein, partial [Deltaproteobacteria bacterium]|nr:GAF domain-containing protein [Deltaproteobacteria bacterium]
MTVGAGERLADLYAVSRALVGFSSVVRALRDTLEITSRTVPLSSIIVVEQDRDEQHIVSYPELDESDPVAASALAHARRASAYLTASERSAWHGIPDGGFIVVPLVVPGGEIFGVIQFDGAKTLTRDAVEFLNTIGNHLAIALDRDRTSRRAAAQLQSRLEFTRAIAASLGEGTLAVDCDDVVTFLNPAAAALLGTDEHAPVGRKFASLAHFEHENGSAITSPLAASVASGSWTRTEEHVLVRPDGTKLDIAYTSSPIYLANRIEGAVLAFDDIRERKRAERDRRLLLEAAVVFGETLDADTVLTELAQFGSRTLGESCFVDVLTTDHHLVRAAWAHTSPTAQIELDAFYRATPSVSPDPRPALASNGKPVLADVDAEWWEWSTVGIEEREVLERLTGGIALVVPLVAGARRLGAITVFSGTKRTFDAADLAFAEKLAARGATALEHARLYRQARGAIGLRDQMLAIVSHDLRNPISAARLGVEQLADPGLGEPER